MSQSMVEPTNKVTPEKVEALQNFMYAQPLHREIFYRVLSFCQTRRMLTEVEHFIMQLPEFAAATQSPFFIIEDLRNNGGLVCIELDEKGEVVSEDDKQGLDENEIDDLVVDFAYENTGLGNAVATQCHPQSRFSKLIDDSPENKQAYIEVMQLLTEKRGASAIDAFLHQRTISAGGNLDVPASTVIEKLEKAGVIYWHKGWMITDEGKELLLDYQS